MVMEYDAEFKHWLTRFLRDFFLLLGLGDLDKLGKATVVNVDQVARTAMPDQIIRIDAKEPFCVHIEVDTSPPPDGPRRNIRYAINAAMEYNLPVYSIQVFLRKSAWTRAWTGVYYMDVPFPGQAFRTLAFHYRVVRLWLIDPKILLQNPGTIALAPLGRVRRNEMPDLMDEIARQTRKMDPAVAREQIGMMSVLMGLNYKLEEIDYWLRRLPMLQESVYYQHLISKGEQIGLEKGELIGLEKGKVLGLEEGLEKGLEQGERDAILRVGQARFKKVPKWVQAHLAKVSNLDDLRKLVERVAVADSWDEALRS